MNTLHIFTGTCACISHGTSPAPAVAHESLLKRGCVPPQVVRCDNPFPPHHLEDVSVQQSHLVRRGGDGPGKIIGRGAPFEECVEQRQVRGRNHPAYGVIGIFDLDVHRQWCVPRVGLGPGGDFCQRVTECDGGCLPIDVRDVQDLGGPGVYG